MHYDTPFLNKHEGGGGSDGANFFITALYAGFSDCIRAQEAVLWLKHSLEPDMKLCATFWSFRDLERLDVRAMSLHEEAEADVVIISAPDTDPVPDHIKRWLDTLLQQQGDARAVLVALHEGELPPCASPGPLCSYLEDEAVRWHTDFMCNEDFDRRLDSAYAVKSIRHKRREQRSPYAGGWGINE